MLEVELQSELELEVLGVLSTTEVVVEMFFARSWLPLPGGRE